jgi:hypothetical protein
MYAAHGGMDGWMDVPQFIQGRYHGKEHLSLGNQDEA